MEEERTEEHKPEEPSQFDKKLSTTEKIRQNPWILSSFVLGVLIVILVIGNFSGMTGSVVNEGEAENIVLDLAASQIGDIEITNIEKESGLYKIYYSSIQGDGIMYLTLDGKNLVQVIPLSVLTQQETPKEPQEYSEADLEKLREFSSCLADKGLVIYGANWCGWTKKLAIDTLGGFDVVGDAYIECTEEEELCSSEGVSGYPTIKINGELYSGERTLESLGEATGCTVPELEGTGVAASSSDASCN